jgi:N-acetylmuramic acid 6-phosphate etherase
MSRNSKPLLRTLQTEQPNRASAGLDSKSALQIARIINAEDQKVPRAVRRALPQIARAIDLIANALGHGGRLIYVGTGTSGRLGALDAVECAPTFNIDPRMVQFVIAGGRKALGAAVESNEDSASGGLQAIATKKPGNKDVVVGIAASGRTPFTVAAVHYARQRGARTISLSCNRRTPLEAAAELAIVVDVGPEILAGSTRMKAGTAEKIVLNMLSTGAFSRLGYVYDNLMANVRPRNVKLTERGIGIIERVGGVSRSRARKLLMEAGNTAAALVMLKAGVDRRVAEQALRAAHQNVSRAIEQVHAKPREGSSLSTPAKPARSPRAARTRR